MENGYPQPGQATVPGGTSLPQSGHLMSESILKPHCGQACALSLTFVLHSGHRINILPPPPTLLCPTRVLGLSLIHISEPTRLGMISYAVFCLKKKKNKIKNNSR